MSLTTEESTRLATLKTVRDKLMMGQVVQRVTYNGFETNFAPGDLARVESEIERLEAKAGGKSGRRRGAMGFRF